MNAALTWLFDVAVAPAIGAAPLTTLLLMSVVTGLAMLWVVGRTSNQPGIGAAKRGIQAGLFEIRLFNDDLGAVMRALGRVLWQNLRYLGHSMVPLAWVALPLTLVIAQLQAFYGYDGLALGAPALLTMRTRGPAVTAGAASLQASDAIRVDTPAVVLSGPGEVLWRIVAMTPGEHVVTIRTGSSELAKTVQVSTGAARRSPFRVSGLIDQLLYPSEPPLPADSVATEIALPYPEPGLEVLGWRVHWLVVYVVVSMITAFALARRLGVTL